MVVATWSDNRSKVAFNIYYHNSAAFLRAYGRMKHATLDHAVDDRLVQVVRPETIEVYRRMKK